MLVSRKRDSDGRGFVFVHSPGLEQSTPEDPDRCAGSIQRIRTGTGTPVGDVAESHAIRHVFGDRKIPVSSTKSLTGHGIGAAGVQELIYCLLMMKHGFITASVNIEDLDPAFEDLNIVRENRDACLNKILTNGFGFGGTNASMIIGKV